MSIPNDNPNGNEQMAALLARIERVQDVGLRDALRTVAQHIPTDREPYFDRNSAEWSIFEDDETGEGISLSMYQF